MLLIFISSCIFLALLRFSTILVFFYFTIRTFPAQKIVDSRHDKQLLYLSNSGCCFCGGLFKLYVRRRRSKCVGLCSIWADKNESFLSNASTLTSSGSFRGKLLLYATSMQKGTHHRGMLQAYLQQVGSFYQPRSG